MRLYKVDPELNRICDEMDFDEDSFIGDYELGSSGELFVFSKDAPSSIWIDRRLMTNNSPLLRTNIKVLNDGIEFMIYPLVSILEGSIVLSNPTGNYRYNLIFKA
jgi:hypothetical protein